MTNSDIDGPRRQLVDDMRWHIARVENDLASGQPPTADEKREMQWHVGAAKADLDRVAKTAPNQWWRTHKGIIALIGLCVSILLAISGWAYTYADNGALQGRVTTLQDQLTEVHHDSYSQMTALVDNQLAKGNISLQTVLQYVPNGQGLSLSGQALVITSPARPTSNQPAVVPGAITVTGTVNTALNGRSIWIFISTPGINRFYPQGSWPDGVGPAILDANHQWASPTVYIGAPGDKGRIFYVIAVLADAKASNIFWQYLKMGASTHIFPGLQLPSGATEYDRVEVVRG